MIEGFRHADIDEFCIRQDGMVATSLPYALRGSYVKWRNMARKTHYEV